MRSRLFPAIAVLVVGLAPWADWGSAQTPADKTLPPGTPRPPDAYFGGIPLYRPGGAPAPQAKAPSQDAKPATQPTSPKVTPPKKPDAQALEQARKRAQRQALQALQTQLRAQQAAKTATAAGAAQTPAGDAAKQAIMGLIQQAVARAAAKGGGQGQGGQGGGGRQGGGGGQAGGGAQGTPAAAGQAMTKPNTSASPQTSVDIHLANPAAYGVTWGYLIDGKSQSLPSGYAQKFNRPCVIEFDRGGDAGTARYTLTGGVYEFSNQGGRWDLIHRPDASPLSMTTKPSVASSPVTPAEEKMFHEMYGKLDLDAATLKILRDGWTQSTSDERKAEYDRFMGEIKKATAAFETQAAGPAALPELPSLDRAASEAAPVSAAEQKMFDEMYGQVKLDADIRKILEDDWRKSSSAERKRQYDDFMAKVQEATRAPEKKPPATEPPSLPALPPLQ